MEQTDHGFSARKTPSFIVSENGRSPDTDVEEQLANKDTPESITNGLYFNAVYFPESMMT